MSLSDCRMLGVEVSKSSRKSVRRSAARLYFSLERFILSCSSMQSFWSVSYSFQVLASFFSISSSLDSRQLIKSSLPRDSSNRGSFLFGLPIEFLRPFRLAKPADFLLSMSYFSDSSSLTCSLSLLMTFWQKWDLLASSFSTSLCISMSLLRVSI